MKKIKVLLIFCNWEGASTPALGVTSIATHLLSKGYDARIFDDAPYLADKMDERTDPRELNLSVTKTNKGDLYTLPHENMYSAFAKVVESYEPDIVGISASRYGFLNGIEYLRIVKQQFSGVKTIVGGAFAMSVPDRVLSYDCVDMVAVGDGEIALEELCKKLSDRESDIYSISGIWAKDSNGKVHKNAARELFNPDENPPLRFDLFDERRFYRPIGGRIRRSLPLEIARGCPYRCRNCSVPLFEKNHRNVGKWFRMKSVEKIEENILNYLELYRPEYFFFMSPTFLGFPKDYTRRFIEMYSRYKIPFYMFTRPEQIDEDEISKLKDVGLNRMSVGIECGNEKYRKEMLGRAYSNKLLKRAFDILNRLDIEVTTNVIIGLPDETKEMIFESIKLVRDIMTRKTEVTVSIYQAYEETPLYQYCIDKGYYDENMISSGNVFRPNIRHPYLSDKEILKYFHCFNLFIRADEAEWAEIDKLDIAKDESKSRLNELRAKYSDEAVVPERIEEEGSQPTPFAHC